MSRWREVPTRAQVGALRALQATARHELRLWRWAIVLGIAAVALALWNHARYDSVYCLDWSSEAGRVCFVLDRRTGEESLRVLPVDKAQEQMRREVD